MRSTPIILDRLRHIRYDLQAVWDMDHIIPGGFESVLEKEVSFEICRTLLWFGLISEDPHLTTKDTRKIMQDFEAGEEGKELFDVFTVCTQELFNSGWFYNPEPTETKIDPLGDPAPDIPTVSSRILELIKLAHYAGLSDDQIWKYTPAEIESLYQDFIDKKESDNLKKDFRMGMICKVLMDTHGIQKKTGGLWSWEDFTPRPVKPQTPQQMLELIRQTNAAMGGNVNG